jgi:cytoskeleton-associated protein 5
LLEFLLTLVQALARNGYILLEGEAQLLCPILCARAGHNNAILRQLIRNLLLELVQIYPASKICGFLLGALTTKNNKTKAECLEILGVFIANNGINVILPKDIKNIA